MFDQILAEIHSTVENITWKDVVFIVLVALVTRWVFYNLLKPFLSPLQMIPGKPFRPIVGNMFEATRAEAMSNAIRWMRELKSRTIRYYHFNQERILTADPQLFRHILVTRVDNYHRINVDGGLQRIVRKALFFLNGDFHHSVRKLLNPAFNVKLLDAMLPVFESKMDTVVAMWQEMLEKAEPDSDNVQVPIQDFMSRITLDSICDIGLDYHPDAIKEPKTAGVQKINNFLRRTTGGGLLGRIIPFWNWLPLRENKLRLLEEAYIMSVVKKSITDKREKLKMGSHMADGKPPKDMISLLLLATDEEGNPIPDDLIRDNVAGLMFAGFDTTSITLTWILLQLSLYPEVQQRLRDEVLSVIPDSDTVITHELLDRLQYMHCVVKETQRLYPVVSSIPRRAVNDDMIGDIPIPAGTVFVLHVGALHRLEENWKDAEQFKPERFMEDTEPYKFLPFGTGQYGCLGQKFAQLEIKVVVARLIREFQFSPVPGYSFRKIQSLTVKPNPPLILNVSKVE